MTTASNAMDFINCIREGKDDELIIFLINRVKAPFSDQEVQELFYAIDERNADGKPVRHGSMEFLRSFLSSWGVPTLDVNRLHDEESDQEHLSRVLDNALQLLSDESPDMWYDCFAGGPREDGRTARALCYLSPLDEHQHAGVAIMDISVSSDSTTVVSRTHEGVTISKIKVELNYAVEDYAPAFFATYVCDIVVKQDKAVIRNGDCEECLLF